MSTFRDSVHLKNKKITVAVDMVGYPWIYPWINPWIYQWIYPYPQSCSTLSFVPSEQLFSSDGDVCGDYSACLLNELSFIGNK